MKKMSTKTLVTIALLIALEIVLSRIYSIQLEASKDRIGFGFVPVMISGAMFGPFIGGIVGLVSDVIRAILFPTGPFNPLFSISAMLRGIIYGVFFFKKERGLISTALASILIMVVVNLALNSLWCTLSYNWDFWATVTSKSVPAAINAVVQIAVGTLIWKVFKKKINF